MPFAPCKNLQRNGLPKSKLRTDWWEKRIPLFAVLQQCAWNARAYDSQLFGEVLKTLRPGNEHLIVTSGFNLYGLGFHKSSP
jgi:hypothetical protein